MPASWKARTISLNSRVGPPQLLSAAYRRLGAKNDRVM